MVFQTIFVRLPAPFGSLQLQADTWSTLADLPLPSQLVDASSYLRTRSSLPLDLSTPIHTLQHGTDPSHPIDIELGVRLLGGKGGFGSQLRAAGGRMSSGKNNNVDSCRDLSGRRLSTIKEAQRQAELLESAPALRAQVIAAEKAKLEALERTLGVTKPSDAEDKGEGSSKSTASKRIAEVDIEEIAKKRYKFNDNQFFEESREIKDNVRSAVAAGLLKKKKKKPVEGEVKEDDKDKGKGKAVETVKQKQKDKVAMPPPLTTETVAAA